MKNLLTYASPSTARRSRLALSSFLCSMVALICISIWAAVDAAKGASDGYQRHLVAIIWLVTSLLGLSIAAVIAGLVGRIRIARSHEQLSGRVYATVGMLLGIVASLIAGLGLAGLYLVYQRYYYGI